MIDYYTKYLKYKSKYFKLLENHKGGFMMSDESPNTLYSHMKAHFDKPQYNNFFNTILQNPTIAPNQDISFLNSVDYTDIYKKLIKIITTDKIYEQKFINIANEVFYKKQNMHNYHIQLSALMTMSFLIELELFSVVHNYIPFNINTKNNNLPSIFAHHKSTSDVRYYKPFIKADINDILKYFTTSLDKFFCNFMNSLIKNINLLITFLSKDEILEAIVPLLSRDHIKDTFDFIYVDWKERVKAIINKKTGFIYSGYDKHYSKRINRAIDLAMKEIENSSTYIAEGTGFFSFLYLLAPDPTIIYNGSCITYSMLELYIMARLHVHASNLKLDIEADTKLLGLPHNYWKTIQTDDSINIKSLSHWTTIYDFSSLTLHFRSVFPNSITSQHSFMFEGLDKSKLCLLLLYPIFDSYIKYIEPLKTSSDHSKISNFINDRIKFIKTLFSTQTQTQTLIQRGVSVEETPPNFKHIALIYDILSKFHKIR